MSTSESTLTMKRQVTIPREVSARWRPGAEHHVARISEADGSFNVKPVSIDARDIAGKYSQYAKNKSLDSAEQKQATDEARAKQFKDKRF